MATLTTDKFQRPLQLDFKTRAVAAPSYKMMRIPLNNIPSGSTAIGVGSSVSLEWKLPTLVYNLARSYISYNVNVPAQGAGVFGVTHEDIFDLGNSVTFGNAGGVDLVNLQFAQNYTKIARKIATPIDDYMGNDDMSGLYKGNMQYSSALAAGANLVSGGYNKGFGGSVTYIASDNYLEPKYSQASFDPAAVIPNVVSAPVANKVLDRYRQYPLGAFTGTLLGIDRDFYSPTEMYLRVQAGTGDKMAFGTTSVSVPTTGIQSAPGVTVNNVYLYLCVEKNMEIVEGMMERYRLGKLVYNIPYTTAFKTSGTPNGTQSNISIQLSQQYGKRLKRILHTIYNPQEGLNTAYDCANYNGEKVTSYQTFLDSMPIQDRILSCLRPAAGVVGEDDWLENKKYLDRRSVYLSKEMYAINWFHIDQFFEPHDKDGSLPEVNLDEGIVMDTPKTWLFSGQVNAAALGVGQSLIHYTFAEFARDIAITPNGPMFV